MLYFYCDFTCAFSCLLSRSKPPILLRLQSRSRSKAFFAAPAPKVLINTKRHLYHLSVSCRSSGERRQAGQENKQPTLPHRTCFGINGLSSKGGGNNQGAKPAPLTPARQPIQRRKHANGTARCGASAQQSVNKHFHAEHRVYDTVSGGYNKCREAEGAISQPSPRRDGGRPPHTQTTNHHGTEIDVSSSFEIYHPGQVAVETSADRLLNKA